MDNHRFLGLIENSVQSHWELPAFSDFKGATYLFKDVACHMEKMHILLAEAGIKPGNKIALIGRNSSHWAICFFGILTYGAVAVPILHDFKPDIIQIFGSENEFGDICSHTDIPVVIHMQGCLPPYHNALFPVGMNKFDFLIGRGLTLRRRFMGWRSEPSFRRRAEHEINTIRSCKFFMGRTDWDKALVSLFNPDAKYFHCEEALRDSFLNMDKHWVPSSQDKIKIISVISNPWYKGVDLILKTAKLLKQFTKLDFEWNVFGVSDIRFYEYKYGIVAKNVNVNIRGSVGKEVLVNELCNSSVYVHPSYIDNSPNSVCEAQLIGIPVLATNVGGIPTLVKDGETGFLFPANDPYMLANLIKMVVNDRALSVKLCASEISVAKARHNPDSIKTTLLNVYNYILNEK